ncbi:MAG: GerW family sporulation protein [Firmicutes bacterium]|nr:GerW family sporulation protein [Bacillota bacterium]MDD4693117.1 GerW family sporulation protein [Bacillota bacterium]
MPDKHPVEGLMDTAMQSLKEMIDVNTILGDPVESIDGSLIIPVSRVFMGFAAGGSEFGEPTEQTKAPFGGGSGAGISLRPVAFLVVSQGKVKLLPVGTEAFIDRVFDLVPNLMDRMASNSVTGAMDNNTTMF